MTLYDEWLKLRPPNRKLNIPWKVFELSAEIYKKLTPKQRERNGQIRTWERVLEYDHLHGKVLSSEKFPPIKNGKELGKKFFGSEIKEGNK